MKKIMISAVVAVTCIIALNYVFSQPGSCPPGYVYCVISGKCESANTGGPCGGGNSGEGYLNDHTTGNLLTDDGINGGGGGDDWYSKYMACITSRGTFDMAYGLTFTDSELVFCKNKNGEVCGVYTLLTEEYGCNPLSESCCTEKPKTVETHLGNCDCAK